MSADKPWQDDYGTDAPVAPPASPLPAPPPKPWQDNFTAPAVPGFVPGPTEESWNPDTNETIVKTTPYAVPGYNQPFGELKPFSPGYRQATAEMIQSGLMKAGMQPYPAGHIGRGIQGSMEATIPGYALGTSALEAGRHIGRGEYGDAAVEAALATPLAWPYLKSAFRAARTALPAHMGGTTPAAIPEMTPNMTDALTSPSEAAVTGRPVGSPSGIPGAPSTETHEAFGDTLYNQMRAAPVFRYDQDFVNHARDAIPLLRREGYNRTNAPNAFATLDDMLVPNKETGPLLNIDDLRGFKKAAWKGTSPEDKAAGAILSNHISDFIHNPPPGSIASGTAADAKLQSDMLHAADQQWAAKHRSDLIETAKADTLGGAGASYSGLSTDNPLRQMGRRFAFSDAGRKILARHGFNQDETQQLRDAIAGSMWTNANRRGSKLLSAGGGWGQSLVSSLGAGLGAHLGGMNPVVSTGLGAVGAAVPMVAGGMMRRAANTGTEKAFDALSESLRQRTPLYRQLQYEAGTAPNTAISNQRARDLLTLQLMRGHQ